MWRLLHIRNHKVDSYHAITLFTSHLFPIGIVTKVRNAVIQFIWIPRQLTWRLRSRTQRFRRIGPTAALQDDSSTYIHRLYILHCNSWTWDQQIWKENIRTTINKHNTAVNLTDSSGSSSRANITPRIWVVCWRTWIDGICKVKWQHKSTIQ